jgi:hypothetical protein
MKAQEYVVTGHMRGKIVLKAGDEPKQEKRSWATL